VSGATFSRVGGEVREFFLLEHEARGSASLTESQRSAVRAYYDAAIRRMSAARDLRGPDQTRAAVSMYRAAGRALAFAFLLSRDARLDVEGLASSGALFERLGQAFEIEQIQAPPVFDSARSTLASPDLLALDSRTRERATRDADELERATRWLSTLIHPYPLRRVRSRSAIRLTTAALGVLGAVGWLGMRAFAPKNVALDKLARASSSDWGTAPAAAVDGEKNGRFGFHSREEKSPWWSVDLGRPRKIATVKVFGRGDCCYEQSVPLALEASDDGTAYRIVGERTDPFSESEPWVVQPEGVVARFVRLRTERPSSLVLGEVEIYERRRN
jgi:F5/8 type C domain